MDKKRILLFIIFVIVAILFGTALWFVFFRPTAPRITPTTPDSVLPTTPGAFPQAGVGQPTTGVLPGQQGLPGAGDDTTRTGQRAAVEGQSTRLAEDALLGLNPSTQGGAQFYNRSTGLFYRVGSDGRIQELSDKIFFNVQNVTWSPTNNESIIEYPDGSNIYYNFDTKRQVTLPKEWEDFSFSPEGDKLVSKSIGFSEENRWLIAANPDGSGVIPIEPLGSNESKVIVDWSPNRQIVALARTGKELGDDRQELLFVGQNGENFPSTIVEGRGLTTQWSKEGSKLLYSVYSARSDFRPELWVVGARPDNIGSERKLLNINTWADKCAFQDDRYLICGVPTNLGAGSGFAPGIADQTPDTLYRIDTQTGLKTELPLSNQHTVDTISYNAQENRIYFTDKNQLGLFRLDL